MRGHPAYWLTFGVGLLNSYANQKKEPLKPVEKYSFLTLQTLFLSVQSEYLRVSKEKLPSNYPLSFGATAIVIGTIYCSGHLFGNMVYDTFNDKKDKME